MVWANFSDNCLVSRGLSKEPFLVNSASIQASDAITWSSFNEPKNLTFCFAYPQMKTFTCRVKFKVKEKIPFFQRVFSAFLQNIILWKANSIIPHISKLFCTVKVAIKFFPNLKLVRTKNKKQAEFRRQIVVMTTIYRKHHSSLEERTLVDPSKLTRRLSCVFLNCHGDYWSRGRVERAWSLKVRKVTCLSIHFTHAVASRTYLDIYLQTEEIEKLRDQKRLMSLNTINDLSLNAFDCNCLQ